MVKSPEVNAYEFIAETLPSLMLANDEDALKGAVACADYLHDNSLNQEHTRGIALAALNLAHWQERDRVNQQFLSEAPLALRSVGRPLNAAYHYERQIALGTGLFWLAVAKADRGLSGPPLEADFNKVFDNISGMAKFQIAHRWFGRYYTNILDAKKPVYDSSTLYSGYAVLRVLRAHTKWPARKLMLTFDERRYRRLMKRVSLAE